jgi:hypothetical protein
MTSLFAPTSIYVTSVNDICKNENLTDNNKNTEYMSPCGSKNTINYAAQKSKRLAFKVHWVLSRSPISGG